MTFNSDLPSDTILRRLFIEHLNKVNAAANAIIKESPEEEELILKCFSFPKQEIQEEVAQLKEALLKLEKIK